MIDRQKINDAYQTIEIYDAAFIRSEHSIADAPTKVKGHFNLMNTLNFKKPF